MSGGRAGVLSRVRGSHAADSGAIAIIVAIMAPLLLMFAAFAVDVARWYVEAERVQKAADAGALAGVPYMPQDFDTAIAQARLVAGKNGYTDGGTVSVRVERTNLPSQLKVSVSSTITNSFATVMGFPTKTVTRSAVADYNGPAPMGSPCNTYGNEPAGSPGAPPVASQLPFGGFVNCSTNPQFWGNVHGPNVVKTQGDQYNTRYCDGGESGCTGSTNNDFVPTGYFLVVKVLNPALTGPIRIQIYDPAYVSTGSRCDSLPGSIPSNNMNPYATTDARTRYDNSPNTFCTGDNDNSGLRVGDATPTVTSFGLRNPTDTFDGQQATPYAGCTQKQYPGFTTPTVTQLQQNSDLTRWFHQWVDFCTIANPVAGQYYLQVRTNVPLGGNMFTQDGDNLAEVGNGSNRFAVRAISNDGKQVSVAGWQRMPVFANSDNASSTFNLIRVLPGAAGKRIKFTFFDVGDAAVNGSVTMVPPTDATTGTGPYTALTNLTNCTGEGKQNGALPSCQITGIQNSSGWNGQAQTIYVPIPATYSCDFTSNGGCWFRVNVNFPGGQVTDATTWTATVEGDPVRIVQ